MWSLLSNNWETNISVRETSNQDRIYQWGKCNGEVSRVPLLQSATRGRERRFHLTRWPVYGLGHTKQSDSCLNSSEGPYVSIVPIVAVYRWLSVLVRKLLRSVDERDCSDWLFSFSEKISWKEWKECKKIKNKNNRRSAGDTRVVITRTSCRVDRMTKFCLRISTVR